MTDSMAFDSKNCKHCGHTYQQHTIPTYLHVFACGELGCECSGFSPIPTPPPPSAPKTYQIEYADGYYIAKDGIGVINFEEPENLDFAEFVCAALNDAESRDD